MSVAFVSSKDIEGFFIQTYHPVLAINNNVLKFWVDLDLFYAKVKICHLGYCMGKKVKIIYFRETIAARDLTVD